MLADKPSPSTDMHHPIPDEPPVASSSARPRMPKRGPADAISSDDSSTDEDEPRSKPKGKRRMRHHSAETLSNMSAPCGANMTPRTGEGKRTPPHSPPVVTRKSNRHRLSSQPSDPSSPRTPQQPVRPKPTPSPQSTPTRSLALNSSGRATASTQAPDQLQLRETGSTFWVSRGADSGWAVVTGVTPMTAHHPLRYNLCSNAASGAGSPPRQHSNISCRRCFSMLESELTTIATMLPPPKPAPRLSKSQRRRANFQKRTHA